MDTRFKASRRHSCSVKASDLPWMDKSLHQLVATAFFDPAKVKPCASHDKTGSNVWRLDETSQGGFGACT